MFVLRVRNRFALVCSNRFEPETRTLTINHIRRVVQFDYNEKTGKFNRRVKTKEKR